jgi:uncharacterized membrane protein
MDTKRLMTGTLVGGIMLFVLGYLIFDLAAARFYAANAGSATGVARDAQLVWAVALGSLSYAALITLAIGSRAGVATIGTGVQIGAVVGFLLWFTTDFILYGITNVSNLTRTVVDPLLELVRGGISGGVTAAVLGRISASARREVRRA